MVTTLDSWGTTLWRLQAVTNPWLPLVGLSGAIVFGSYLLMNLMIAELLARFEGALAEVKETPESSTRAR